MQPRANLDQKAAYRLRLAVDEIATNIIVHGYEEAGIDDDVTLITAMNDQTLTITIKDEAPLRSAPARDPR